MRDFGMDSTVAFIGIGVMGSSMARRLRAAGFPLLVHTRTKAKADPLLALGARWAESPGAAASRADAVITMLGFPDDVEQVYFGPEGLVAAARPGSLLIDMTTTRPALARRIHAEAAQRGVAALDAPVSGGDIGAREGKLSIMVGGDPEAFAAAQPLFRTLGARIVHQGAPGNGQRVKLCNQIAVFGSTLGTCEALAFALRAGLDPDKVLESIGAGAAASWSLSNLGPRVIKGDFEPGFFVRHFLKDIKLALEEGEALGAFTPGMEMAKELYATLERSGLGDKGTQALYLLLAGPGSPSRS
jgi:3-hydroxyisobutyrate dehydrogenase